MKLAAAIGVWCAAAAGAGAVSPAPAAPLMERPQEKTAAPQRMGQAALSRSLPAYPGATEEPVPVGDTIEAKGVPMNVQSFMTDDPPRKVLDFYEAFFRKSGLPMIGNGDMVMKFPYPSVTVMDDESGIDLSVIAVPSPDKRTMVLLARADMRPLLQNLDRVEAERYGGLCPYPKGEEPSAVHFTDGEVHSTHVTFGTDDAPEQVIAFFKKNLAGTQDDQPIQGASRTSVFHGADGDWRITASPDRVSKKTNVTAVHTPPKPAAAEVAP